MTKNLNQQISTRNLVTFKRWDGVKDEKFQYDEVSLKNLVFRGREGHEKSIHRGKLPKRKGLGQFADLRENFQEKRRGYVFDGGG